MPAESTYHVPPAFQKVDKACREFVELVADTLATDFDMDWSGRGGRADIIERIANAPCPGFFPFTEGGWRAVPWSTLSFSQGSGQHAGILSSDIERAEEQARQGYIDDGHADPWEYDGDTPEETRQAWYEYEADWLTVPWSIDVRATYFAPNNARNRSGVAEVMLSVYYNPDEYGRDSHCIEVWERTLSVQALRALDIEALADRAATVAADLKATDAEKRGRA